MILFLALIITHGKRYDSRVDVSRLCSLNVHNLLMITQNLLPFFPGHAVYEMLPYLL